MEKRKNGTESQKLTIADVAMALGVSKTTVSRAISGKGRIGEETRRRVMEYIEINDYKPNVIAKGLAQSKTYNIALLLPSDCNLSELPFFQNCMVGVCEAARERDYDVLLVYCAEGQTKNLERILANHKIDGVLLTRTLVRDEMAEFMQEWGIPIVAAGSSEDESLIQVDHDHRKACRELTETLLLQGIKNIGLIGGSNLHMVTRTRYQGFSDAFHAAGVPLLADLIYLNVETSQMVDQIVDELLYKGAECIMCMDDMICNRVLQKLQKEHIHVPEQIKVASFYGSQLLESHIPEVTTLRFDAKELGAVTCNTLLDAIEGRETERKTLLSYEILIKETTK